MTIDRRYIFALVAAVVMIPLIIPIGFPVAVSDETRRVYERIEALDSGTVVMVSFDHEASSLPEVRPLAEAVLSHCFRRGIRVVGLALFAEGTAIGNEILTSVAARYGRVYGSDYVYLGYRPQYAAAILGMGESITQVFPADYSGTPCAGLALLREVRNYDDVAEIISIADGSMPTYWVEYAQARYGKRVIAVLAAVMVTAYKPYRDARQLDGIVGGLIGAAEYERLLGRPGAATRRKDPQSLAHLTIAGLIILGNVVAFIGGHGKRTTQAAQDR